MAFPEQRWDEMVGKIARMTELLKDCENVLVDYIETQEKRGASLYYGRSVLARIRAELQVKA
jgi:hypothetical protein